MCTAHKTVVHTWTQFEQWMEGKCNAKGNVSPEVIITLRSCSTNSPCMLAP